MTSRFTSHTIRTLTEMVSDETAPPIVRAELDDFLHRHRQACSLLDEAALDGEQARADLAQAKRDAPNRLYAALAHRGRRPDTETIAAPLGPLREAVDAAEARHAIIATTVRKCEKRLTLGVFSAHRDALLPWIAGRRIALDWWIDPPAHVLYAWERVASQVRVELPRDAWITDEGNYAPGVLGLTLNMNKAPNGIPRVWYVWHALATGQYTTPESGALRITADWAGRPKLPRRKATGPSSTARPAAGRSR